MSKKPNPNKYTVTAEFTNLPAEKFDEVAKAVALICEDAAMRASSWPHHPSMPDHSLVEVEVVATTVFGTRAVVR